MYTALRMRKIKFELHDIMLYYSDFFLINTSINTHIEKMKATQKQTNKQTQSILCSEIFRQHNYQKYVFDIF